MFLSAGTSSAAAEVDHDYHKNHAVVFAGAATGHEHTRAALGVDYEHRPIQLLGGLLIADLQVGGPLLVAGGLVVHPAGDLKFNIAAGIEFQTEGHDEHEGAQENEDDVDHASSTPFVLVFGVAYDFHAGLFTIGPALNID